MPDAVVDRDATMARAIGARLRAFRVAKGWTQGQAARVIGTHRPLVSRVESGSRLHTLPLLSEYAQAYGCTLADIVSAADEALAAKRAS